MSYPVSCDSQRQKAAPMAEVAKPVLPPMLYRYRKITTEEQFNQEVRAIRCQLLWFAPYRELNDPMEGFFAPASRLLKNTNYTDIARNILQEKQSIGICCFSDTHRNELMWTHYADSYTGICVGYRTEQLIQGLPPEIQLVRLAYEGEPPEITAIDANNARSAAIKVLSHKKVNWIYEREWRLLGNPQTLLPIEAKGCVRHVYFGSRMRPDVKEAVLKELKDMTLRVSEMVIDDYDFGWNELKALK
jgi:hypothetical protein